jgi:nucleotide-binding universal stress UspA family protein
MDSGTRKPVLAGFDLSEASRAAVSWAAHEASSRRLPLLLVHVMARPFQHSIPIRIPDEHDVMEALRNAMSRELDSLEETCGKIDSTIEVEKRIPVGDAAQILGELAEEASLVVLGGPLVGSRSDRLGATAAEVVARRAAAPIVVVRGNVDHPEDAPVVVGVDGSEVSKRAVGFAHEYASRHSRPLVGVHSWSDSPFNPFDYVGEWEMNWTEVRDRAHAVLAESMAGWGEEYPDVRVRHVVSADRPVHTLLDEAKGASLLVVGSHGRGPVRRALLGSVSHAVLNQASCPVAISPGQ